MVDDHELSVMLREAERLQPLPSETDLDDAWGDIEERCGLVPAPRVERATETEPRALPRWVAPVLAAAAALVAFVVITYDTATDDDVVTITDRPAQDGWDSFVATSEPATVAACALAWSLDVDTTFGIPDNLMSAEPTGASLLVPADRASNWSSGMQGGLSALAKASGLAGDVSTDAALDELGRIIDQASLGDRVDIGPGIDAVRRAFPGLLAANPTCPLTADPDSTVVDEELERLRQASPASTSRIVRCVEGEAIAQLLRGDQTGQLLVGPTLALLTSRWTDRAIDADFAALDAEWETEPDAASFAAAFDAYRSDRAEFSAQCPISTANRGSS